MVPWAASVAMAGFELGLTPAFAALRNAIQPSVYGEWDYEIERRWSLAEIAAGFAIYLLVAYADVANTSLASLLLGVPLPVASPALSLALALNLGYLVARMVIVGKSFAAGTFSFNLRSIPTMALEALALAGLFVLGPAGDSSTDSPCWRLLMILAHRRLFSLVNSLLYLLSIDVSPIIALSLDGARTLAVADQSASFAPSSPPLLMAIYLLYFAISAHATWLSYQRCRRSQ